MKIYEFYRVVFKWYFIALAVIIIFYLLSTVKSLGYSGNPLYSTPEEMTGTISDY